MNCFICKEEPTQQQWEEYAGVVKDMLKEAMRIYMCEDCREAVPALVPYLGLVDVRGTKYH